MKRFRFSSVLLLALLLTFSPGCFAAEKVTVYHAGSLAAPMAKIEALYEAAHPDIDILRESGGSAALARKITDLGGGCDVFLSADYMVIEKLLRRWPSASGYTLPRSPQNLDQRKVGNHGVHRQRPGRQAADSFRRPGRQAENN